MGPRRNASGLLADQAADPVKAQRAYQLRQSMTPAEQALWQRLRANRLDGFHFRRQQVIAGFIVDFYCHAVRLAVEVDGPVHAEHADYDRERDDILSGHGLRILRLSNEEVLYAMPHVLTKIHQALYAGLE